MKSTKCPQCGLVYWSTAPNCKRCGLPTADYEGERPVAETESQTPGETPCETQYYAPQPARTIGDEVRDEQLLRNLKRDARLFYFIGGLQALAWFFIGNLLIVDAAFNIGLAFVAHKFKSRVAAIFLLLLTVLSVMVGILMFALGGLAFNPFLPLVLIGRLFASGRIVYSTFMLKKYAVENFVSPPPPPVFHPEAAPQWAPPPAAATQWPQQQQQTY